MKATIDLDRLAELAMDLESGHPIEAVLRRHGIPEHLSAYDVVRRHQKNRGYLATAKSDFYKKFWKGAVAYLQPCIAEIAEELGYEP
jgi:hypothetical protein